MTPLRDLSTLLSPGLLIPPIKATLYDHFAARQPIRPTLDPHAGALHWGNTWWMAEASLLAYHAPVDALAICSVAGFTATPIEALESFDAYVLHNDAIIIVVFRGTELKSNFLQPVLDWHANLAFDLVTRPGLPGRVHHGLADGAIALSGQIDDILRELQAVRARPVWLTGHSQGGALATLMGAKLTDCQGVYTFGAPRVGDQAFKDAYSTPLWRICNQNDPVSRVPFEWFLGYRHVGQSVWFDSATHPLIDVEPTEVSIPNPLDHAPVLYSALAWNQA